MLLNDLSDVRWESHVLADFCSWPETSEASFSPTNQMANKRRRQEFTKRALRILLEDYTSSFDELLQKIDDTMVHVKNLRNLMVEIYKCLSCENPPFMWNIFQRKELGYNLRSGSLPMLPQAKTTTYGTSSLTFRGSILWNSLPDAIKSSPSVVYFKKSIKEWKGENCTCKNCC